MKLQLLLLAALLALLVTDAFALEKFSDKSSERSDKPRKLRKYRRRPTPSPATAGPEVLASGEDVFSMLEQDAKLQELQEESKQQSDEVKLEAIKEEDDVKLNEVAIDDPCATKHCGAGRVCDVNTLGVAECVCIPECSEEEDPRRKVCTNHNETWNSDCAVYRMRCECERGHTECLGEEYKHVHIEYYGECREMPKCQDEEMADFPRRMRDWLFNIMRDLADRHELTPHYLKLEREAETNMSRRWSNAAVWKWCDLDGHPHDRTVSRHELFPIRAPLMSLEHCIAPFFDNCDSDDDHRISLQEWGKCLGIDPDDIEDKCEQLREEIEG